MRRSISTDSSAYVRGQLGVVLPTFDRKNLVVAYRYFSGAPLTSEESRSVPDTRRRGVPASPIAVWLEARRNAGGPGDGPIDPFRVITTPGSYSSYRNCLNDAFITATAILNKRIATWGAGSANLRDWIIGQDQVFSNCSGPENIPNPPIGKDPLLFADRQYQIAAAAFYAGDWELARKSFDQVAANPASPWQSRVPYLKARVSLREATIGGKPESYARAEAELTALHETALLDYLKTQAKPLDRLTELCDTLSKPQPGATLSQDLTDFTFLYDKLREGRIGTPEGLTSHSDLADWIDSFQQRTNPHALQQWHASKTLPWLVAALSTAKADDPSIPELIAAANDVAVTSPAYATVNYYAALLQQDDPARQRLDAVLKQPLPLSSRNLFLHERMRLATDWQEFLSFAPRNPAGENYDGEEDTDWKLGPVLGDDAVAVFNRSLPLSLWIEASRSPALTPYLQNEVRTAAWVRAVLLDKAADARRLAGDIQAHRPELAPIMKSFLLAGPKSAKFTAVYFMMKTPGLCPWLRSGFGRDEKITKLSPYRDNWWSKLDPSPRSAPEAIFLSQDQAEDGAAQWNTLSTKDSNGATFLASETVRYVADNPADPRAAEALALAVRATHLSTTDDRTEAFSKQAFKLLHAKFPDTAFARDTKYWYK